MSLTHINSINPYTAYEMDSMLIPTSQTGKLWLSKGWRRTPGLAN